MSSIPGVYFEYLAFSAFWLFVVGLDLVCLWNLRRSRVEAMARFLWVVWIVVVPIVGAITYFIVQPTPEDGGMRRNEPSSTGIGLQHQHWNENIQR